MTETWRYLDLGRQVPYEKGVIVAAMMAGDMHASPRDAIDRVADAWVGARAGDVDDLRLRIASVFDGDEVHRADGAMGVTTDDLLTAVDQAIAAAGTTDGAS